MDTDRKCAGFEPLLHEGVRQVGREVDAETDGDDDVGRGHDVDGQAPEVHEPTDVRLKVKQRTIMPGHTLPQETDLGLYNTTRTIFSHLLPKPRTYFYVCLIDGTARIVSNS